MGGYSYERGGEGGVFIILRWMMIKKFPSVTEGGAKSRKVRPFVRSINHSTLRMNMNTSNGVRRKWGKIFIGVSAFVTAKRVQEMTCVLVVLMLFGAIADAPGHMGEKTRKTCSCWTFRQILFNFHPNHIKYRYKTIEIWLMPIGAQWRSTQNEANNKISQNITLMGWLHGPWACSACCEHGFHAYSHGTVRTWWKPIGG